MDWKQLKDRVTDEVLRQLQEGGAAPSAAGAGAPPGAPAAGFTQGGAPAAAAPGFTQGAAPAAVLEPPALPTCEVGPDFKTDLLVVVAGPVCDGVTGAITRMAEGARVTVVSSGYSERLTQMQACSRVLCEGNEATARRLVEGATQVVVPVITTSVAAKVAGLIGDCLASSVLVQAALQGKRAVVARESMATPKDATWSIRRKVEDVADGLRAIGFTVTTLDKLGQQGAKGKGGYLPAYTPHPAVLASRLAKAEAAAKGAGTAAPSAASSSATASSAAAPAGAPASPPADYDRELARMIDHTLLKPEATEKQVRKLCEEARAYGFMSVCVNPGWVPLCAELLKGSPVKVCTVIGFPLGATSSTAKSLEAADAIAHGATEVDMVVNVGALKSGQYDVVLADIQAVVSAARGRALVKVIIETGLLTDEEKVKACELSKQAGADFVKTSTGFGPGGATPADIALMRKTVGPNLGVKASGGIRDYETARAMVAAGANRIGASASIAIATRVRPKADGAKGKY